MPKLSWLKRTKPAKPSTVSPLGREWMRQLNAAIDKEFQAHMAAWPMNDSSDASRMLAMERVEDWISKLPVASVPLVMATILEMRK